MEYRTCPLCEATCGLEIHVRGEEVTKIRGDKNHVFSRGFVCPKGVSLHELHADPDRLRKPMIKRGGVHVEVEWEEAYAEIERRLLPIIEESGRNAVAIYLGNPNAHNLAGSLYLRFLIKALGTRNIFSASTVDQMPRHVSSGLMYGSPNSIAVPDLDHTKLLLLLGTNPFESNGSLCTAPDFPGRMREIQKRGGRIIVVDPRRTRTAQAADEHLPIRPGSDALLLVSMIHVILEEEWHDLGRVGAFLDGLEEVRLAVAPFTPERVAERCGIPAEKIRSLAAEISKAESTAIHGRIGVHTGHFGTLTSWASDILSIITGNLDQPGGAMFPRAAHSRAQTRAGGRGFKTGRWKSRVRKLAEVMGEFPVSTLIDEITTPGEGQIRALVTVAGNPVLSTPDARNLDGALGDLDFMVSVDIYCNETTRHADVILPPPSPLERSHYDISFTNLSVRNFAHYSAPTFKTDAPSEADILAKLSLILGHRGIHSDPSEMDEMLLRGVLEGHLTNEESPLFGQTSEDLLPHFENRAGPDALLDLMIRTGPYGDGFGQNPEGLSIEKLESNPHGVDLGPLTERLPEMLSTPSGRIEMAPREIMEDFDRLDIMLEDSDSDQLVLIGRRDIRSNNSWMHNLKGLLSGRDRCSLHINPVDAEKHSLQEGDAARIASRAGNVTVTVHITEDLIPGVVSLPHGWGHGVHGTRMQVAHDHAGINSNILTDRLAMDPISGNAVLNGIPVDIVSSGSV
ncbi:MAG: molybdopterin-dependent oxidoreductase [Myxococcota bacterium]|nr:molybdopterin-dependent oxidoreductase [Myxococcota bacterium]